MTFIEGLRLLLDMAMVDKLELAVQATISQRTKLRVVRNSQSVAQRHDYVELVKFTDDTYRSLSNDTIITSSSDKREWCVLKGNILTAQQGKSFWRK